MDIFFSLKILCGYISASQTGKDRTFMDIGNEMLNHIIGPTATLYMKMKAFD